MDKSKENKRKLRDPLVYVPEEAELNFDNFQPLAPPRTEYESRRTSIGAEALKKITGK